MPCRACNEVQEGFKYHKIMKLAEYYPNPNLQTCKICGVERYNYLFDRLDGVCNWCDERMKRDRQNALEGQSTTVKLKKV